MADIEMKDEAKKATDDKKEGEDVKEEPNDQFYGKWSMPFLSSISQCQRILNDF